MAQYFKELENKWALVLGSSSGFGGEISKHLARAGMNIVGIHLDRKATMANAEAVIKAIEDAGREALFVNMNASDEAKRKEVLEKLKSKKIRIWTLVHSLAFGTLKPFFDEPGKAISKSQMEMTLDVMAHSLVYWSQELVAEDLLEEGGRIFAMTSAGGERVFATYGAVSAAKAALESHIRQIAMELAPKKITANAVRAGVTDTPALRKIPGNERMMELAKMKNPAHRLTTPEDIAKAVVAFSLPHTGWLSGNVLGVDGGENVVE